MKGKMGKSITTLLISLSLVTFGFFTTGNATGGEKFRVNLATTNVSSGNYPWAVGISEVINKYVDNCVCKTIALGGPGVTVPALHKGEANFATNQPTIEVPDAYRGKGMYKSLGPLDIRWFTMREFGYMAWYVSKSSGVKNVMDLRGKKMNQGSVGSLAEGQIKRIEAVLNIGVKWTAGSTGIAKRQIKDRQIIGYVKSSPGFPPGPDYRMKFDASALDVNSAVPLTIAGFTEEQKDKIIAADPSFKPFWSRVPAGGVAELPDLPAFWLPSMSVSGMTVLSTIPQDVQYRILKALVLHWHDVVAAAYPPCGVWDPLKDAIRFAAPDVPFAAGLVQLAKERGIAVPKELIPPEYKD